MKQIINSLLNPNKNIVSSDASKLFFRVLVSISMINTHGIKKLIHFSDTVQHIPDPLGLGGEISAVMAIIANIVAPLCIIFGLFTRLATIPILAVTLMGFFVVHASDPWSVRDIPLMYSLAYILILFLGSGKYALDYKLFKNH